MRKKKKQVGFMAKHNDVEYHFNDGVIWGIITCAGFIGTLFGVAAIIRAVAKL